MAFASGLFFTSNSFIIKGTGLSFGEVNTVRSIIQIPLMICIILVNSKQINLNLYFCKLLQNKYHFMFRNVVTYTNNFSGDSVWPKTCHQRLMLILVGISGSLMMLASFACIKFMPVPDATTLMFTSPLFTMIFSALIMKQRLTYLKGLVGK